ncbi:MAG TPA: STAS domain-containing protein [Acidimicrobiales bacterium]|nr:STAS domain-containing protein [Acidimicrobiales bacterium]
MNPVTTTLVDDVVVATLEVDVDIANTELIGSSVLGAVPNHAIGLVLDLTKVRYLDSAGIRMLFMIIRELDACRQRASVLLEDESPVRKLLKITNVDEVVYVCSSLDDCVRGLHEGRTGGL